MLRRVGALKPIQRCMRNMCNAVEHVGKPDGSVELNEKASRRAKQLFWVRRANDRPADGMDVWGVQGKKRARTEQELTGPPPPLPTPPPAKRPAESLLKLAIPLGTDPLLRDQYSNAHSGVRIGKLLEDFDSFAGQIAYTHVDDDDENTEPLTLVTAAVDRIDLLKPIPYGEDVTLVGCCSHVGTSSMSIDLDLLQSSDESPLAQMTFTYVARDRWSRAVPVAKICPEEKWEKSLVEAADRGATIRKARRAHSVYRVPPTPEEYGQVHRLFVDAADAGAIRRGWESKNSDITFMDDTENQSTVITGKLGEEEKIG